MTKLFGTDGIRGLVNDKSINSEMGFKVGRALVEYCRKINNSSKVIIARDTRESGLMLEAALSAGIIASGGEIILVGIIPTPGLAWLTKKEQADAGVVISASHNDHTYNGFKIFKSDGTKLNDNEEAELEAIILKDTTTSTSSPRPDFVVSAQSNELGTKAGQAEINSETDFSWQLEKFFYREENLIDKYVNFLLNTLPPELNFNGVKIVLDCSHGSTYEIAPRIFKKLGATVESISIAPDGKNINANCGSQHTEALQLAVRNSQADVGMAFDGDGDRLVAVTEEGKVLTGDHLLYVYSRLFLEHGWLKNNLVVSTVMSNIGFINALRAMGAAHKATEVGDRAVFFEMSKSGAALGGEESCHIIFSKFHTTGDGILSALMLTWAIKHHHKPLSELSAQLTLAPKLLLNVEVKQKPELSSIAEIRQVIKEAENYFGAEGRVLVRYSGTEPLCRIMIEGRNEEEIKNLAEKIGQVIKNKLN